LSARNRLVEWRWRSVQQFDPRSKAKRFFR